MTLQPYTPEFDVKTASSLPIPRGPALDWSSFKIIDCPDIPSMEDLAHTAFTSSGRAAIYQALLQLQLPPGSTVLIPSYHSLTMVAPVIMAKLNVAYFGLGADGRPNLDTIDETTGKKSKAMLVTHYFGIARSLAEVRQWCDEREIALIEDCAHCYFGEAGERPVGAWGDLSTASLSKFFPISEGGLLASANRPLLKLRLKKTNSMNQLKGVVDVLEFATKNNRFKGMNRALSFLFWLKNSVSPLESKVKNERESTVTSMIQDCDMARINQTPLWTSTLLKAILPRGRIIANRQRNFTLYEKYFQRVRGARPLYSLPSASIAPYVFPLWVDDADRVYNALKKQELPVFRWDRVWPETPCLENDVGPLWNHHVLQLVCHQDLSEADIERTALAILSLLSTPPAPVMPASSQ